MKSGLGSAAIALPSGLVVGAIVAVNAAGDIINPATGQVVAGTRSADGSLADVRRLIRSAAPLLGAQPGENTTIGVVATNAKLTKAMAARVALMTDDGYARAIAPSHTMSDGDTVFVLATGRWDGSVDPSIRRRARRGGDGRRHRPCRHAGDRIARAACPRDLKK